jgi:hypothetical protein
LIVPLEANFQDDVSGIEFTLLFDPTIVRIAAVSLTSATGGFTIQTSLTGGTLRVALASANSITGAADVVELTLRLIGPPGTTSTLDIVSAMINEGDFPVSSTSGLITIVREAKIVGAVFYYDGLRPVPSALGALSDSEGNPVLSATTDTNGGYVLGPLPLGNYHLVFSKAVSSTEAINVLDASDILRSIVGHIALSPDQQRAADVSGNDRVGTVDVSLILRFLVGLETSFPAGPFWQFNPTEQVFDLLEDKFQNFTAFLIGDVNGDWEAPVPASKTVAATTPSLNFSVVPSSQQRKADFVLNGANLIVRI